MDECGESSADASYITEGDGIKKRKKSSRTEEADTLRPG